MGTFLRHSVDQLRFDSCCREKAEVSSRKTADAAETSLKFKVNHGCFSNKF